MAKKSQPDVEYVVYSQRGGEKATYLRWDDASAGAIRGSLDDLTAYVIDVVVYTFAGARRFAGRHGELRWAERGDPGAVFERMEIRADSLGVPP